MKKFVLICLSIVGILWLCSWWLWLQNNVSDRDFEKLLHGSSEIALINVDIEGTPLNDPVSLRYLSVMFRSAKVVYNRDNLDTQYDFSGFGASYIVVFWTSTTGSAKCSLSFCKSKNRFLLHFPIDGWGDGDFYSITLREPVPAPLLKILSEMK